MTHVISPIAVEQNTLKRRGVGLRACDVECTAWTIRCPFHG